MKWLLFVFALMAVSASGKESIVSYTLNPAAADRKDTTSHVHVVIEFPEALTGEQQFIFPRSVPMGYEQLFYDSFVSDFSAFSIGGVTLPVKREDGPRWRVGSADAKLAKIAYNVDLAQMEAEILSMGNSSRSRPGYVFLLGYTIFGYIEGSEDREIELRVTAPSNRRHWPLFSTLDPKIPPRRPHGPLMAKAKDFYSLADSQVVVGPAATITVRQASPGDGRAPCRLFSVVYAETDVDREHLENVSVHAFECVDGYFGVRDFPVYTLISEYLKLPDDRHHAGFSIEHLQSASVCGDTTMAPSKKSPDSAWSLARNNIAHHVTHAWIPKRSYGEGYYPFRWELTPLIDNIWFSEGFGQYAAMDALADAMPEKEAAEYRQRFMDNRFRKTFTEVPAFLKQMPLKKLCLNGSTLYALDFRTGRTIFSRGAMMAYEMDQFIRQESGQTKRLRDALRGVIAWSAREKRAFRIEELPEIFREATGVDTRAIMDKWLAPMPE
ncbi:MAG TPA: hypothetical protein VIS99_04040 [Terrimicrobiaceae bacterium]